MRLATGLLGALGLSATAWSGAWVYGKGAIRDSVDEQIALMREQGIEASYSSIEIGGFPFGYDGRVIEPRYAMVAPVEQGTVTYRWQAPWIGVDASAGDLGGLFFTVPETQTFRMEPPLGAAPVTVTIDSAAFRGRLSQIDGRTHVEAKADALTMNVDAPQVQIDAGTGMAAAGARVALASVEFSGTGPQAAGGGATSAGFDGEGTAASATVDLSFGGTASESSGEFAVLGRDVKIVSRSRDQQVDTDLGMQDIALSYTANGMPMGVVGIESVSGRVSAPVFLTDRPQRVAAVLSLTGVDLDARIWQALDPTGAFSRDIQEVALDAEALARASDGLLSPGAVTINRLVLRGVGLEVLGDARGGIVAGQPEGEATLRFTGVAGFIDSAVSAGLMPAEQATVYKLMIDNFARRGETENQKVFRVAMRNGMTFVNGMPVGPAPELPQ